MWSKGDQKELEQRIVDIMRQRLESEDGLELSHEFAEALMAGGFLMEARRTYERLLAVNPADATARALLQQLEQVIH